MTESDDPGVVHTVVVTATDLVTALESNQRTTGPDAVLRITPPFSGRMRARLHVAKEAPADGVVHLRAESLVEDACPAPPEPDDVEDAMRADPQVTYTVDRHRERYREVLRDWRTAVPTHVVDEIQLPATTEAITISILGTVERD